jgi:hypothetical protein
VNAPPAFANHAAISSVAARGLPAAAVCTTKAAFDPALWDYPANASPTGSNPDRFQKIVSLFQP